MALKFVDMFCGMGTIRMGFEQAGWECVYSVEWDKHKRRIYQVIFGREPEGQDIRTVRGSELPAADCWCFGAPCQDFSIAGKRAGMEGDRSSLVKEVFRLVRETTKENRPQWLLYENVKGMLSSNGGLDYLGIVLEMESLGYDVEWQLLNSKDFGVPQNRERVFTLGHIRGICGRKIFPITKQGNENTTVGKSAETAIARCLTAGGHSGGNHSGMTIIKACLTPDRAEKRQNGRRLKEDGEPMFTLTKQDIHGVMIQAVGGNPYVAKKYKEFIDENGYIPKMFNPYNCQEITDTAPTLTAQGASVTKSSTVLISDKPNWIPGPEDINKTLRKGGKGSLTAKHNYDHIHDGCKIRRLTPRECMRLQGVSDEVTDKLIAAGISDTQMYRAAGDATTVNVLYEIAIRLGGRG